MSPSKLGCYNLPPAPETQWVQNGWIDQPLGSGGDPRTRIPVMIEIAVAFQPVPCGYQERLTCPDCQGCRWLEFIEAAAIQSDDGKVHSVPRPGRHHDVIALMDTLFYPWPIKGVQGFLLRGGRFVGREEARAIAVGNGQATAPTHETELFSEDLWR